MANRPLTPCLAPGCPNLIPTGSGGYCKNHEHLGHKKRYDRERGTPAQRGYDAKWRVARLQFLRERPLCECPDCKGSDHPELAEVVHHTVPHRGDMTIFWDKSKWLPMAKRCHDKHTASTDGGFGNPAR